MRSQKAIVANKALRTETQSTKPVGVLPMLDSIAPFVTEQLGYCVHIDFDPGTNESF